MKLNFGDVSEYDDADVLDVQLVDEMRREALRADVLLSPNKSYMYLIKVSFGTNYENDKKDLVNELMEKLFDPNNTGYLAGYVFMALLNPSFDVYLDSFCDKDIRDNLLSVYRNFKDKVSIYLDRIKKELFLDKEFLEKLKRDNKNENLISAKEYDVRHLSEILS